MLHGVAWCRHLSLPLTTRGGHDLSGSTLREGLYEEFLSCKGCMNACDSIIYGLLFCFELLTLLTCLIHNKAKNVQSSRFACVQVYRATLSEAFEVLEASARYREACTGRKWRVKFSIFGCLQFQGSALAAVGNTQHMHHSRMAGYPQDPPGL